MPTPKTYRKIQKSTGKPTVKRTKIRKAVKKAKKAKPFRMDGGAYAPPVDVDDLLIRITALRDQGIADRKRIEALEQAMPAFHPARGSAFLELPSRVEALEELMVGFGQTLVGIGNRLALLDGRTEGMNERLNALDRRLPPTMAVGK